MKTSESSGLEVLIPKQVIPPNPINVESISDSNDESSESAEFVEYPSHLIQQHGDFQLVVETPLKFFVYSAFHERRGSRSIRVIGITPLKWKETVYCQLWFPVETDTNRKFRLTIVTARVQAIRENWRLPYTASFILCPLNRTLNEVPYAVSIVKDLQAPINNILIVNVSSPSIRFQFSFSSVFCRIIIQSQKELLLVSSQCIIILIR